MNNIKQRHYFYFAGALIFAGGIFYSASVINSGPIEYVSDKISEMEEEALPPLPPPVKHVSTPESVRGIYMTSWVAGTKNWRSELVRFIDRTEINSVVIDIKDYTGRVSFQTSDEKIIALEYTENRIPDVRAFIEELHAKNIYVIGRISVFQDPHLVKKRPDLAVKNKAGNVWKDRKGISWVDPASKEAWDIAVRIARESEKVGFDELNFDYIRFPSDGNMTDIAFPFWDEKTPRAEIMKSFFAYLDENLKDSGVPISVDLFGLTSSSQNDLNIGQVLEPALLYFDFVSPMVYPSHYPATFLGYKNPAQYPYEVIRSEMDKAVARALAIGVGKEKIRPWLQDFNLGAVYDEGMVRLEKKAVYDAGLDSWLAWDAANKYTREAYNLE